jgi:pimeloyl-ACP methyl ester carboxylesterase
VHWRIAHAWETTNCESISRRAVSPHPSVRNPNLTYFNEVDRGGHFAAWEEPQLFSEEIRAAFRSLR